MTSEEFVVLRLAVTVNDQIGAISVGAEEDSVSVRVGNVVTDGFQKGVGYAVSESDELDTVLAPVGSELEYELRRRGMVVITPITYGKELDLMWFSHRAVGLSYRHGCFGIKEGLSEKGPSAKTEGSIVFRLDRREVL
jgi:hypothetical protein